MAFAFHLMNYLKPNISATTSSMILMNADCEILWHCIANCELWIVIGTHGQVNADCQAGLECVNSPGKELGQCLDYNECLVRQGCGVRMISKMLYRRICSKSVLRSKPKNVSYHFEPQFSGWSLLISYHLQKNNHPNMWIGRNIWRYLKFHSCTGQGWLKCGVGSERNLWHFFGS